MTAPHFFLRDAENMTHKIADRPLALIGDLGATNTRVALVQGHKTIAQCSYATQEATSLESMLEQFMSEELPDPSLREEIVVSCFGVAGHVSNGAAHLTNVGWVVRESTIREMINAPALLVNDFYVQAAAVPVMSRESVVHLCGPELMQPNDGRSIAILGAGSGLGEAILIPRYQDLSPFEPLEFSVDVHSSSTPSNDGSEWIVVATEGGHTRFAPRNEAEVGLNRWLKGRYGDHVSVERVVSGAGVVDLFLYFLGGRPLPVGFSEPVTGAQVTHAAFENRDSIALNALTHFVGVYADEAANLTLKSNAGAVYLSGGVTPHLLPMLHEHFSHSFLCKGRYNKLLANVSVWVVIEPDPGLLGAQVLAERLLNSMRISSP